MSYVTSKGEYAVYTPTQLSHEVRGMLETVLANIWIEGEISNLARPSSGHIYFSLKDSSAQIRCALFRARASRLTFRPDNGDQVRLRAKASLYPARGEFQLIVEHLEEAGEGALRQAFEQLKQRLEAEGLFAAEKKRPLPSLPRRIGVITSPSGAAIQDVLTVLERRCTALPVMIYPVAVQGDEAAEQISRMLRVAAARNEVDVLLLTRGGGSLEDLWPFNEEIVARAIRACPIPVISAVGHEVDVTIADLAADLRAPTPSAAAETLSIDTEAYIERLNTLYRRLRGALCRLLGGQRESLGKLEQRLVAQHPERRLRDRSQRLDELERRLQRAGYGAVNSYRNQLSAIQQRLFAAAPQQRITELRHRLDHQLHLLHQGINRKIQRSRQRLISNSRAMHAISPLATLERGYAIVQHPDGQVIRDIEQIQVGDRIYTRLARGALDCRVEQTYENSDKGNNNI